MVTFINAMQNFFLFAKLVIRRNFIWCASPGSPMASLAKFLLLQMSKYNLIYVKYLSLDPNYFFWWNILFGETLFGKLCLAKLHLSNFIWQNFIWRGLAVPILYLTLPGSPLATPDKQINTQTWTKLFLTNSFGKTFFSFWQKFVHLANIIWGNFVWRT